MGITGVVLAAGRGVRMGGAEHKSLIPIDGKDPLMYYILGGLKRAGVEKILIVTGWRHGDLESFVGERWKGEATFARNPRYGSWGNFHSLRIAIDQTPADNLLVVNCDVIVHPDVYKRTLEMEGDLVLAVERRLRLDEEDMRVHLQGNSIRGIGKDLSRAHSHGEFCGVSFLRDDAKKAFADISSNVEWQGRTSIYYEDVYGEMLDRIDAFASTVETGEYAEVDEPADLAAASDVITRHDSVWEQPAAGVSG